MRSGISHGNTILFGAVFLIYPEEVMMVNNSAETQLQVFNPGSYTLQAVVDEQTLTSVLSTPVNSQAVNPVKIPIKHNMSR